MIRKLRYFVSEYSIILGLFVLAFYFSYHIFYSKRGYLTLLDIEKKIEQASLINEGIQSYKQELNHKVELLSSSSLDSDYLDEMIRLHLNLATKNEYIILK